MTTTMYRAGEHPYWCDLVPDNCGNPDGPVHVGRTSYMFAQTDESRVSLQLWRSDSTVPAGNHMGDLGVLISMTDPFTQKSAVEVLFSVDELKTLALLCSKYVEMAEREQGSPHHSTAEIVLAEGPC